MKRRGGRAVAGRAGWLGLGLYVFAVAFAWAQASDPALRRTVRLAPGSWPLGAVLAELSRQSHVPFSYSSSLVPLTHRCSLPLAPPRALDAVLHDVLATTHLSYGLLNGQLVLWADRTPPPPPPGLVRRVAAIGSRRDVAQSGTLLVSTPSFSGVPEVATGALAAAPARPAGGRATGLVLPALALPPHSATGSALAARVGVGTSRPGFSPNLVPTGAQPTSPVRAAERRPATLASPLPALASSRPARPAVPAVAKLPAAGARGPSTSSRQFLRQPRQFRQSRTQVAKILVVLPTIAAQTAAGPVTAGPRSRAARPGPGRASRQAGPMAAGQAGSASEQLLSARDSVAALAPQAVLPAAGREVASTTLPALVPPAGPAALPLDRARTLPPPDAPTLKPSAALAASARAPLRGLYLHGEAGAGETLPLNAIVKVGWPRLYAVLGIATGPFDRRGSSWVWGGGLGTVGRARGRFTPSLDLLQWLVPGYSQNDSSSITVSGGSLTQLRPALAWQIKRGRRWQLVGGPTLNLATTRFTGSGNPGPQPTKSQWTLGQSQWLWLNQTDARTGLRLWPGVQVGLRF